MAQPPHVSEATKTASALVISAAHKAGMDDVDRGRIDEIILRESGSSQFMQQQRRLDEQVNRRIEEMKKRYRAIVEREEAEEEGRRRKRQKRQNEENDDNEWMDRNALLQQWRARRNGELQSRVNAIRRRRRQGQEAVVVVVDMDAFFVHCELLNRPDLVNKPTCVGGPSMISTANYVARQYGVRSAMPGWIGAKLVHELSNGQQSLHFFPSNFELYKKKSQQVQDVLREYDPWTLRCLSLDEVSLQLGPYLQLKARHCHWTHAQISAALQAQNPAEPEKPPVPTPQSFAKGADKEQDDPAGDGSLMPEDGTNKSTDTRMTSPSNADSKDDSFEHQQQQEESTLDPCPETGNDSSSASSASQRNSVMELMDAVVHQMRRDVRRVTGGLTCSAGMGPNFRVAKMASERHKPNGQFGVLAANVEDFLRPLSIRKVSGIGRVTEKVLRNVLEIHTIQDLYDKRSDVQALFRPATAQFLLHASLGSGGAEDEGDEDEDQEHDDKRDQSTPTITSSFGWKDDKKTTPTTRRSKGTTTPSALPRIQKGMSCERTFGARGQSWHVIMTQLQDICQSLSRHLKEKQLRARHLTLKVKLSCFVVLSRSMSLEYNVQHADQLLELATELLQGVKRQQRLQEGHKAFSIRLLGVRVTQLESTMVVVASDSTPTTAPAAAAAAATTTTSKPQLSLHKYLATASSSTPPKMTHAGDSTKQTFSTPQREETHAGDSKQASSTLVSTPPQQQKGTETAEEDVDLPITVQKEEKKTSQVEAKPAIQTPNRSGGQFFGAGAAATRSDRTATPDNLVATTMTKCPICQTNLGQHVNIITMNRHLDDCLLRQQERPSHCQERFPLRRRKGSPKRETTAKDHRSIRDFFAGR